MSWPMSSRTYSSCITEPCEFWMATLHFPLPWALAVTVLLSASVSLTILGTLSKWNRAKSVLLWLAYFTEHNVFWVHQCCCVSQDFLLFKGWIIFHCKYIPYFVYHSPVNGHLAMSCSSVAQSCPTLSDPMDCSTPGFPVFHHLLELAQTHIHCINDAIQPSHPLLPLFPLGLNLSQHQGLFQWIGSSYQVAKVFHVQLQHQSFQWTFRANFL